MRKTLFLSFFALLLTSSLIAQQGVMILTDPRSGNNLVYGEATMHNNRAMTDDPTILWQKYENGAMPDDVFYIEETGDYFVYYGLNDKRVVLFDANGNVKWQNPITTGGRGEATESGNLFAYSDANDLYVVDANGQEIFHETFNYPVTHIKLAPDGTKIYVSYGRYEDNYYAIARYTFGNVKEPDWVLGDLTVNVVGLGLSKNGERLVASFAQGYRQIWVLNPATGEVIQDDLPFYDNSPSQDPALSANGEYLAYADFSGMGFLYHWNGERFENVWTASISASGTSSVWGCANAISADGSTIAFGTLDFVSSGSGYDGSIYLFNNYSSTPLWSYHGCGDEVTQAALNADGSLIGFVSWGPMGNATSDFFLFRRQSNEPIVELNTAGSMEHIDLSEDGTYCFIGGKAVHCREMGSGSRIYAIKCLTENMGTLTGTVDLIGSDDNSGVTVSIAELDAYYATTAIDGTYTIRCIPTGTYTVTTSVPGYIPVTIEGVEIIGEEVTTLDITMEPAGIPINDLYASQGAYDHVELTWTEQDGATGYNIYRKNAANAPFDAPIATIGTGEGYFEDHTVIPTQDYYYAVTAQLDEALETPYSNVCLGYATTAYITHTIDVFDGAAPTIDGIKSEGEWNDAFRVDVSNYLLPAAMGSVTLHLKMDDNYLYVCSENRLDTEWTTNDGVAFYIDDNNDGTYPPSEDDSEGNYWMYYGNPNTVRYRPIYNTGGVGTTMNLPEEIIDCDMSQGYETIEFALPLGNDETWKINTDNGNSGLYLFVRDAATATMYGKWPAENTETFIPLYYGVMNYHVENTVPEPPTNLRIDEQVNAQGVYTPIMWDMPEMNDVDHFNLYFVEYPDQHEEVYGTQWIFEIDDEEEVSIYVTTVDQAGQESVPSEILTFYPGTEKVGESVQQLLNLYPNPTRNILTLNGIFEGRTEVKIIDLSGRIVKCYVVNGLTDIRLNVSDLQRGVYFVSVSSEASKAVAKFVVE